MKLLLIGLSLASCYGFLSGKNVPAHAVCESYVDSAPLCTVEKFKARLVADGNTQKFGIDFDRIFSTVVKSSTICLVFIVAAARDYNLSQIDIRHTWRFLFLPRTVMIESCSEPHI